MKVAEIRKYDTKKLTSEVTKQRLEIVRLRRSIATGDTQNVRDLRHKRKDLARMLTVLSEQLSKEVK